MPHAATRWSVLTLLVLLVHLPWFTTVQTQRAQIPAIASPPPAPADGSGYPAPQVDESVAPAGAPETF